MAGLVALPVELLARDVASSTSSCRGLRGEQRAPFLGASNPQRIYPSGAGRPPGAVRTPTRDSVGDTTRNNGDRCTSSASASTRLQT